jgi:hypothetical protein
MVAGLYAFPSTVGEQAFVSSSHQGQRKEPLMTAHLSTLVKCVTELHQADLEACHCVEEFHLQRIHPLSRWEKLANELPRLADPSRYPAKGDILTPLFNYCTNPCSDLACFLARCSFVSGADRWVRGLPV